MKRLTNESPADNSEETKKRPLYAPHAVKPPPPGLPDPRGWHVSHSKEKTRPHSPWIAYAYIEGEPVYRRFRDEEKARGFAAECNAAAGEPHPEEPLLRAKELRARMHLSRDQLKYLKEQGLPFVKISRQDHRYYLSEVRAYFQQPRETGEERVFIVEPLKDASKPHLKFRVRGTGKWKNEANKFKSEKEAECYARSRNHAVGRKAKAPLPRRVRGMDENDPFYRVRPCQCEARPDLHYEVIAYFEGDPKPKIWRHRTEGEALHFANCRNLEAERMFAAIEAEAPAAPVAVPAGKVAPAHRTLPVEWTEAQLSGIDSRHSSDPMKGPPFRILATVQGGYSFIVRGPADANGKVNRKFFHTEREAKTFAHMRNTEAQTQGLESVMFPSWLRVMALRNQQRLEPYGKTIDDAVRHYAAYLDRTEKSRPVGELVEECFTAKISSGVGKHYASDLRKRLHHFAAFVGSATSVSEIGTHQVNDYLISLEMSGASRNHVRRHLCTFFSYAKPYIMDENPAKDAIIAKTVPPPVGILTPDELAALLSNIPTEMVPFIAIGAFVDWQRFALLQSRAHESWALFFGSTLEDRPVYTPTDCFETFPFPAG